MAHLVKISSSPSAVDPEITRRDAVAEARHAEPMLRIRKGPGTLPQR